MEVQAITKNVGMSAQKMREVVRQIQGLHALHAEAVLAVVPRKGARIVAKTLRSASVTDYELQLACDGVQHRLHIRPGSQGAITLNIDKDPTAHTLHVIAHDDGTLRYEIDGVRKRVLAVWVDSALHLVIQAATFVFTEVSPWPSKDVANDPSRAVSPVAGVVAQVLVKPGDAVTEGQPLLSVEAMKMEMWLSAKAPGVVKAVHVAVGEQVQSQALLLELDLTATDSKES